MEMTFRKIRIRNYIRASLLRVERNAESLYITKFNPFYKWRVGNLEGEEIKDVLSHFNASNKLPDSIRKNSTFANAFSLLLDFYREQAGGNERANLTKKEWFIVRESYEKEIKREYETNFGKIGFNENIHYNKLKKGNTSPDFEKNTGLSSEEINSGQESEEAILTEITGHEIESLLDIIYQGNWVVKIIHESKNKLNYRIAILNLHLPDKNKSKILNEALNEVQKYFTLNSENTSLELKSIAGKSFIQGYFTLRV